jgi:hypothetical protein
MEEPIRPQKNIFDQIARQKKVQTVFMYLIFVVSILIPLSGQQEAPVWILKILSVMNMAAIIVYFSISCQIDYKLFPKAEEIRRWGLYDNAFGAKFAEVQGKGYFTNDDLPTGLYKLVVNFFNSCLFTLKIGQQMKTKWFKTHLPFIIIFIFSTILGFINNPVGMPFLQFFLSVAILGDFIKLYWFVENNEIFFGQLKAFFSHKDNHKDFKTNTNQYLANVLKIYADYECNLARGILLDSKIYQQLRPELENEWIDIKKRYNIIE